MNKIKFILSQIFLTNIGRIALLFVLTPLFLLLSDIITYTLLSNILFYSSCITATGLGIYIVILMVYAYIINPLKELKENNRIYEELKNKHNL